MIREFVLSQDFYVAVLTALLLPIVWYIATTVQRRSNWVNRRANGGFGFVNFLGMFAWPVIVGIMPNVTFWIEQYGHRLVAAFLTLAAMIVSCVLAQRALYVNGADPERRDYIDLAAMTFFSVIAVSAAQILRIAAADGITADIFGTSVSMHYLWIVWAQVMLSVFTRDKDANWGLRWTWVPIVVAAALLLMVLFPEPKPVEVVSDVAAPVLVLESTEGDAMMPAEEDGEEELPAVELTDEPAAEPTIEPTPEPTSGPTAEPTAEPTALPEPEPTVEPTPEPTVEPTPEPTLEPVPVLTPDVAPDWTLPLVDNPDPNDINDWFDLPDFAQSTYAEMTDEGRESLAEDIRYYSSEGPDHCQLDLGYTWDIFQARMEAEHLEYTDYKILQIGFGFGPDNDGTGYDLTFAGDFDYWSGGMDNEGRSLPILNGQWTPRGVAIHADYNGDTFQCFVFFDENGNRLGDDIFVTMDGTIIWAVAE